MQALLISQNAFHYSDSSVGFPIMQHLYRFVFAGGAMIGRWVLGVLLLLEITATSEGSRAQVEELIREDATFRGRLVNALANKGILRNSDSASSGSRNGLTSEKKMIHDLREPMISSVNFHEPLPETSKVSTLPACSHGIIFCPCMKFR